MKELVEKLISEMNEGRIDVARISSLLRLLADRVDSEPERFDRIIDETLTRMAVEIGGVK